jgi:hypothetical protein
VLGFVALFAVLLYRPALSPALVIGGVAIALFGVGLLAGFRHGMPMTARNLGAHARIGFFSLLGVAAAALGGNAVGTRAGSGWAGVVTGIAIFAVYNTALFSMLERWVSQKSSDTTEQRQGER